MGSIKGELLTFKVTPTKRARLFYTVRIFDNFDTMSNYAYKGRKFKSARYLPSPDCGGLCSTYHNPTNKYEAGEILFMRDHLGVHTVSHEVSHAMFGLKRRKRVGDLYMDANGVIQAADEEWAVDAVGHMLGQVYRKVQNNADLLGLEK